MKKILLVSALSIGTLVTSTLPGVNTITANAATSENISISTEQNLLQQLNKYTGSVIEKHINNNRVFILIKTPNGTKYFTETFQPELLKNINVGDTINIYGTSLGGTSVDPGLQILNPILQKNGDVNVLETQYMKRTGTVIEKGGKNITIQVGKNAIYNTNVLKPEVLDNINIGDTVNIHYSSGADVAINNMISIKSSIVEKIEDKTNPIHSSKEKNNINLGVYTNKYGESDYIMGSVIEIGKAAGFEFIWVEYPINNGSNTTGYVKVITKDSNIIKGDIVKVKNMNEWLKVSSFAETNDNIEKVF
ncbi:TPA: hypothetical protein QCV97_005627 [Bacillus cereus]|nr:hypothetical protein [Bacillus cereus]